MNDAGSAPLESLVGDPLEGRHGPLDVAHLELIRRRKEVLLQLPRGPEGDDAATGDERVSVHDRLALQQVVAREQDGAAAGHPVSEDRTEAEPHVDVHVRERLVEEEQLRGGQQDAREFGALPLAHRHLSNSVPIEVRDPQELGGPRDPLGDLRRRMARHAGEEPEVLRQGHVLIGEREVEDDPEMAADLVWGLADVDAAHDRVPRVRLRDAGQDAEARRLPRPVRPEQAEHLALPDFEGDLIERACRRIQLREAGGLDEHPVTHQCAHDNGSDEVRAVATPQCPASGSSFRWTSVHSFRA